MGRVAAAAVIFDLDGTVWDSHWWVADLLSQGDPEARASALAQLRAGRPAATLLREAGITKASFRDLCAGPVKVGLYTDVGKVLARMADHRVPLGTVTNLPGWMALPMLAGSDLSDLFASTVTYERTSRRKPHPDPLLLACAEMEIAPAEGVWYVGDSETDHRAAAAAGLSFAWASWGYGAEEPDGCRARLDSFADVLGL